jgi:uncharacterized damage-inducible protein DinB
MGSSEILLDAFGRVREVVHEVVDGLTADQLAYRVDDQANSVGWLVWHLTRVQDDHVAGVADSEQVWTADGWEQRFALPLETRDIGYGHSATQVAAVRVTSPDLLTGYYDAVHAHTQAFVSRLSESDLARIVDTRWDPPVTMAVRLVSVIADDLQHAGQAAFVRGLIDRGAGGS